MSYTTEDPRFFSFLYLGAPLIDNMNKIARGVLHGCIGTCCSRRYPSVFTRIDDAEVWNFIYGVNDSSTQPSKYLL